MKISVLNKHHYKCDNLPADAHYIGRGSALGNPYVIGDYSRETAIALYKPWLLRQISEEKPDVIDALDEIANEVMHKGHSRLMCFCKPLACHGDFISELVLKTIKEMSHG